MLWLQRELLQTNKRKKWGHIDCFALTLDNEKQLILVQEGQCSQWQDGWKSTKFPSSVICCNLMLMQAKTIEMQHWQFRDSNHFCLCEWWYGEVCKIQCLWQQTTRLKGPASPVPDFKFWCSFFFSERDEEQKSTEVNHPTPANRMHVSEEVSSDLQKKSYLYKVHLPF